MKVKIHQLALLFAALSFVFILGACNKKVAHATPPPPPAPTAPTAALSVQPTVAQKGQYVTLSWKTENASEVTLSGMGAVNSSGADRLMPQQSTTYTLYAKGPGGERDASARVTVTVPVVAQAGPSLDELFAKNIKDVFFDFDKYTIRSDQQTTLQADANFLQSQPVKVTLEGHCDDRGSEEYNLALGVSRAEALKSALVGAGVPADRLTTISYGKEKPFCSAENDQCWQSNRRDHVVRAQ